MLESIWSIDAVPMLLLITAILLIAERTPRKRRS